MKITIIFFTSIFIYTVLIADEPPCWCEYTKRNADYIAKIVKDEDGGSSDWLLKVYFKNAEDEELFWESDFYYDGYPEGYLTENGESFIFISTWYYENDPVINVYNSNGDIWQYEGWEFGIPESKLIETVSHHLWLAQEGAKYYLDTNDYGDNIIHLKTVDNQMHYINIYTGSLVSDNDFDEDYYLDYDDSYDYSLFDDLFNTKEKRIFKKFENFFYIIGILTLLLLLALIIRWMNKRS